MTEDEAKHTQSIDTAQLIDDDNTSKSNKPIHGGRNLIILGISATIIAIVSTAVSLFIYRKTGDIYLDRSRPGYISKDEKHNREDDRNENFSSDGEVTQDVIDEYLKELDRITENIKESSDVFSADAFSDENLNISEESEELLPE